jgi:hypothetical protein
VPLSSTHRRQVGWRAKDDPSNASSDMSRTSIVPKAPVGARKASPSIALASSARNLRTDVAVPRGIELKARHLGIGLGRAGGPDQAGVRHTSSLMSRNRARSIRPREAPANGRRCKSVVRWSGWGDARLSWSASTSPVFRTGTRCRP